MRNLLAAVRATRKRTEVFAFADSDGRVTRGWLRALVTPLAEPGVGAAEAKGLKPIALLPVRDD